MLFKFIRIILIAAFVILAIASGSLAVYRYTHDDISAPVITSDYDLLEVSVKADRDALCAGLHAYDNMDGDITDRITVKSISPLVNSTDAIISYLVFDQASNATTYTRTLRYTDYHVPHFALTQPLTYSVGDKITLLDRLSAYDVIEGDISARIMLTQSSVSNAVVGSYPINVQVTNSSGDTAMLPLTITINALSASAPTIRLNEYLLYCRQDTDEPDWRSYIGAVRDPLTGTGNRSDVVCNAKEVDLTAIGTYEVYYYYTGKSGETATAILTVVVE